MKKVFIGITIFLVLGVLVGVGWYFWPQYKSVVGFKSESSSTSSSSSSNQVVLSQDEIRLQASTPAQSITEKSDEKDDYKNLEKTIDSLDPNMYFNKNDIDNTLIN